jgi:hypothetical protein
MEHKGGRTLLLGWIEREVTMMAARGKREAAMNSNGRKKMK